MLKEVHTLLKKHLVVEKTHIKYFLKHKKTPKLKLCKVYYFNTAGYEDDVFTIHPTWVSLGDV